MAIYRQVDMSFWTDAKVVEEFTMEDKYMYLYLITNPHTNLAGCYEISKRHIAFETGFSSQKVSALIDSLVDKKVIVYSAETNEILLINWHKYNWNSSEKLRKPLWNQISNVKNAGFREYLTDIFNGMDMVYTNDRYGIDTISEGNRYPIDTTVSVSVTVSDTDTVSVPDTVSEENNKEREIATRVIDHLNSVTGSNYRATSKETMSAISARLRDGFTEDDFYRVIDGRVMAWGSDPKMVQYLRPSTLFRPSKFEEYLNAPLPIKAEAPRRKSYMDIAEEMDRQMKGGGDVWI